MTSSMEVRCDHCDRSWPERTLRSRCECGGLLTVVHHPALCGAPLRDSFDDACCARPSRTASGVWRFGSIVHPLAADDAVSHPEGNTPLLHRETLDTWTGIAGLRLKHEGHNPTGSFKDRGMTVAVTQARRAGARAVACASTGNTSASLAAYAAQAGIPAIVFVPEGRVAVGKMSQAIAYGARTLLVSGDFDDCLRLVQEAGDALGIYLANSINPFRLEGQKTIVLELLRQLGWQAPDWIVLPAGNLGNTAAFGKALREAHEWGLIDRVPRLAAVQAEGAAPFANAFARGFDRLEPVQADTVATAIRIGAPASYERGVRAIRETDGLVLAVTDRDIITAKAMIDAAGVGCEPASAAAVAGARALRARGTIAAGDQVVAVLTGHLLKDPGDRDRDAWRDRLAGTAQPPDSCRCEHRGDPGGARAVVREGRHPCCDRAAPGARIVVTSRQVVVGELPDADQPAARNSLSDKGSRLWIEVGHRGCTTIRSRRRSPPCRRPETRGSTVTRPIRLLATLMVFAAPALRADDPPKAFAPDFGVASPIYALSGTIGVTYYGWEGTTVFGHTLWAFSAQQYSQNLAAGCFWWNPSVSCAAIAGVNIDSKPYGAATSPNLPGGSPGPQYHSFSWLPGTEIIFAIMVNQSDGYNWFFSGDPTRNDDSLAHLAYFDPVLFPAGVPGNMGIGVVPQTAGLKLFGFEDVIYEHSDWDFDNLLFAVDESIAPPAETVPEPTTLILVATGLGGLAAMRRRRRVSDRA